MPISLDEILQAGSLEEPVTRKNGAYPSGGDGDWTKLWQPHPEGGGPFGGRDTALTKLVGFFRAKSYPYEGALEMAHMWNERFCDPPLGGAEVHDKVGRAWARWAEGGHDDLTPEDLQPKKEEPAVFEFKTANDLLDLDASGGGMEWLIPNVLCKGGVHFVSAPAAGSKTYLMLDLACHVAEGTPWLETIPVLQGPVLYVDEEMGERKMASRFRKLNQKRDLPIYYLGKQGIVLSDPGHRKQIADFCREKGVVLLILDTLTGLMPGLKENESEHVSKLRRFFSDLIVGDLALVVLHHDRKGGKGDGAMEHERMAGSRDLAAGADMAYAIDKKAGYFHIGVSKNRLLSDDDVLSVDYVLEDDEEKTSVRIRLFTAEAKAEQAAVNVRVRIAEALLRLGGEMSTNALAEASGCRKADVARKAKEMAEGGELVVRKAGQAVFYALPSETPFLEDFKPVPP